MNFPVMPVNLVVLAGAVGALFDNMAAGVVVGCLLVIVLTVAIAANQPKKS